MAAVRSSFGWSTAAGLVPVPWLDLAAIIGVQVKMLQEIARIYGQPYPAKMARPLIVALLGGGGGYLLAGPAASLVKAIPVVGPLAGLLTLPALSTASCYATGRVFIQHFESGGTFLDFDPTKVRAYYAEQFSAAKAGL
jgi:uncharacterized protein (DUF697 family)